MLLTLFKFHLLGVVVGVISTAILRSWISRKTSNAGDYMNLLRNAAMESGLDIDPERDILTSRLTLSQLRMPNMGFPSPYISLTSIKVSLILGWLNVALNFIGFLSTHALQIPAPTDEQEEEMRHAIGEFHNTEKLQEQLRIVILGSTNCLQTQILANKFLYEHFDLVKKKAA